VIAFCVYLLLFVSAVVSALLAFGLITHTNYEGCVDMYVKSVCRM
jgi:hypothetical protein